MIRKEIEEKSLLLNQIESDISEFNKTESNLLDVLFFQFH